MTIKVYILWRSKGFLFFVFFRQYQQINVLLLWAFVYNKNIQAACEFHLMKFISYILYLWLKLCFLRRPHQYSCINTDIRLQLRACTSSLPFPSFSKNTTSFRAVCEAFQCSHSRTITCLSSQSRPVRTWTRVSGSKLSQPAWAPDVRSVAWIKQSAFT